jgi:large subunit ribosomal protein L30
MSETRKAASDSRNAAETRATPETKKRAPRRAAGQGAKTIVIEQHGSPIGCLVTHKRVLRSLGLRKIRQRVTRPDNPAVRGMVKTIPHIVRIVEG